MRKKLLLLAILAIFVITFVGCGKKNTTDNTQTITNASDEILSNVKSDYVITKDGKVAIKLTNNNDANLKGLNLNITYYDEEGNLLSSDNQEVLFIEANSEFILESYLPYDSADNLVYPGRVSINLSNIEYEGIEIQNDKLGIKHNKSVTGNVILECTNNYEKDIEAQINIIYYKADNIVACDSTVYSLQAKETKSEEFYKPTDENYEAIEFDTYKLYYNVIAYDEEALEMMYNTDSADNKIPENIAE